ncbi:hypothetical protein P153DRAFT_387921 [Dothidotthia symphoricarpi CBS 119687]|uniref:Transmembrane protein n=1 Tax=Dothidotthia symphoricarpi CBS 119687 TaxID=1392245 RepID=A0A6A6A966_9PLEO|nr:uncharacterized protein P153DRAFT_387921 [Dothidotthia symphoricarpi CBS 119687]KAF2127378.1 hypothetical protein P153DRAFT_387921 [Dothidotthia symphoricarpi CBS 119687]
MSAPFLFFACLLAVCLPIISVQLPRHLLLKKPRSTKPPEARPAILRFRALRETTTPVRARSRFGADASEDQGAATSEPMSTVTRKPWERPFPVQKEGEGSVLPGSLTPRRKTGRELEEKGGARRLFPADIPATEKETGEMPVEAAFMSPNAPPVQSVLSSVSKKKNPQAGMSVLKIGIAAMAFVLFVFGFAILIAHCLAWFIVYKTEVRLGEAKTGVLKGGEMRMCLCAR